MGLLLVLAALLLLVDPSFSETAAERYHRKQAERGQKRVLAWKKMIREGRKPGETTLELVGRVNLFWNIA
jgi:hypothetical protein